MTVVMALMAGQLFLPKVKLSVVFALVIFFYSLFFFFLVLFFCCCCFVFLANTSRNDFVAAKFKGKLPLYTGCIKIKRRTIYDDGVALYSTRPTIADVVPIIVEFDEEEGVDLGGICRDFFSGFWEEAYLRMFDGAALLTPACLVDIDSSQFSVLGRILSHGYLCCGFLPTRIAFPVLALVLLGLSTSISQEIFIKYFLEFLSHIDRKVITAALQAKKFTHLTNTSVINVLSRFGCREFPTPTNLAHILYTLARHHFMSHPFATLSLMNSGVPENHKPFWQAMQVDELNSICESLSANPEKVLEQIEEPIFANMNEQRVFGYLEQFIGEMKVTEAKRFLRFVTGSSVLTVETIRVSFNALVGAARRPIAHTCSNILELPYTYSTFLEFSKEFTALLDNDEFCWSMNSV